MQARGLFLVVTCVSISLVGCSRAAWQAAAQGAAVGASASSAPTGLLLFGGQDHKTFLGCLNCNEMSQSSVFNQFTYGSPYGQTIFNHYAQFGSEFRSRSLLSLTAATTST